MARKATVNSSATIRARNLKAWKAATPEAWLTFVKTHDPDKARTWSLRGQSFTGNCVNQGHNDKTGSMHVHPEKGFVKCFGCGYYENDPVRFMVMMTGRSPAENIREIQTSFDVKLMNAGEIKLSEAEFKHVEMKNALFWTLQAAWVDCLGAWENRHTTSITGTEFDYAVPMIEWLESRKLLEWSHTFPIGILPTEMMIRKTAATNKNIDGHQIAAMFKYLKGVSDSYYLGSMMMAYHSTPVNVARLRLRVPGESDTKKIIMLEDTREDFLGFFGLSMYNELGASGKERTGIGNTTVISLCESETDAMQYWAQQTEHQNYDRILLAHGGATNRDVSELKNLGAKQLNYIPDWDRGGDVNAREIMSANPMFSWRIFAWQDCLAIPGPANNKVDLDKALRVHGWDLVSRELDNYDMNYVKPEYWCKEQVRKIVREQGIEGDDIAIVKLVQSFGPCIGSVSDEFQAAAVTKWVSQTLQEYGLGKEESEKMANDYLARESAELVFCKQLQSKLYERFEFIAVDTDKTSMPVKLWNKEKHELIDMRIGSDAHVKAALSVSVGANFEWVKKELSIPDFVKYTLDKRGDQVERSLTSQEEDITKIVHLALKEIVKTLPHIGSLDMYSSGNHFLRTNSGKNNLFIVNGAHVYRGQFEKGTDPFWEELSSPVFERYLFDTNKPAWCKSIKSLSDVRKYAKEPMSPLFMEVAALINAGWRFSSQESEVWAHTAFILQSSILKIYSQNYQFLASNERGCGKSTLYAELIGGGKGTDINIVEHSHFVDNTTPAGIRQSMDGSSRILIIDEFDNQKGGRYVSEKQQEVLTILRCSSAGEGKYQQGTQGGEAKTFRLSFSTMVAGIDPDITDANMTRFYTTDLMSGLDSRQSPKTLILQKFSLEKIAELRSRISIQMFQYIPELKASEAFIEKYCVDHPELLGSSTIQRFKDTIIRMASLMHAAGLDWEGWLKKVVIAKSKAIKTLSKLTVNENLMNSLLYSCNVEIVTLDSRKKCMVSSFFRDARITRDRQALNESGCGVSLHNEVHDDGEKWYLLVVWPAALGGVLRGTWVSKAKDDPAALKVIADRHPSALKDEQISDLVDRLPDVPMSIKSTHISIFDVTAQVELEAEKNERLARPNTATVHPIHPN